MDQLNIQVTEDETKAFQLKGSLFTLTVLQLISINTDAFSKQLSTAVELNPQFFQHMPVVIDLQKLSSIQQPVDFYKILSHLRLHGLIPVGVRGGNALHIGNALAANLPILAHKPIEDEPAKAKQVSAASKVITQPVRSGQQIYAKGTDLIVLSAVSPGAELLADGHIHVYGALRGRALAGINGNQGARIFCQSLEAELISIAGYYWISEDLKNPPKTGTTHIYLEDGHLRIGTL